MSHLTAAIKTKIQEEALAVIAQNYRCTAAITMGGGKTLLGIKDMARNYNSDSRFLVVIPKIAIIDTWKTDALEHGYEYLLKAIDFVTYRSLSKTKLSDYKKLYLDEIHSLVKDSHDFILAQYGGPILGLTGSAPRYKTSDKGYMVNTYAPVMYEYKTDNAIQKDVLNDYRILIHHIPLGTRPYIAIRGQNSQTFNISEKQNYEYFTNKINELELEKRESAKKLLIFSNEKEKQLENLRIYRLSALLGYESKLNYAKFVLRNMKDKTLVFVNTKDQANHLAEYAGSAIYHSGMTAQDQKSNLKSFEDGNNRILVSIAQLKEGMNFKNLREGIVLHAYSNERQSSQRLGRFLRMDPAFTSLLHVFCYDNTIDEIWCENAFKDFNSEKIYHFYPKTNRITDCYGLPVSHAIPCATGEQYVYGQGFITNPALQQTEVQL
jgi:superfamily II DNA or RNA helicase